MKVREFFRISKEFCKMSNYFISPWKIKDILYFPVAYVKFMSYAKRDIKNGYKY